jgi:hypothetical protein
MDFSNGNWSPRVGIPVVRDASPYEPGGTVYDQWKTLCAATPNLAFKPPSLATVGGNQMSLVCMEHKIYTWYERVMKTSTHKIDPNGQRIIKIARESLETGRYHSFCLMALELAPKPDDDSSSDSGSYDICGERKVSAFPGF